MPLFVKKRPDMFTAERLPPQRVGQDLAQIIIPLAEIAEWCDGTLQQNGMGQWELVVTVASGDRHVAMAGMWVVKRHGDRYAAVMRDEDFRGDFEQGIVKRPVSESPQAVGRTVPTSVDHSDALQRYLTAPPCETGSLPAGTSGPVTATLYAAGDDGHA